LKISIDELRYLPSQKLNFQFREFVDNLGAVKPVLGELTASASSTGIRLSGNLTTLLKLTCHRCLRPYFYGLSVRVDENFVEFSGQSDLERFGKDRELLADDFVEELPESGILDITDVVYQAVTLAIPVSCLCGDDCPGPAFPHSETKDGSLVTGKDATRLENRIDPRWKNLKTLFPKEETE
jgi:uncharacterized protein